MNQQERDDLRTKHQDDWFGYCSVCHRETGCDVIKVLDWAEFLSKELKSISAVWDGE